MNKYIIKNCPAYIHRLLNNHDKVCLLGDKIKPDHKGLYVYCADCTDCLLKQIVEKCKDKIRIYEYYDKDYALGQVECAKAILQLLDIQEVK